MNKIPYNKLVANKFTVRYTDTQYLRGGNTQTIDKKLMLFSIGSDNEYMYLLPTSPYILKYTGFSSISLKYLNYKHVTLGKSISINYIGTPTDEQSDVINNITKRKNSFSYHCGLIVMKTGRGKSHTICQILNLYKQTAIICVHNIKTLNEMEEKIKTFCGGKFKLGVFYGKRKEMGDVIITTHTSFNKYNGRINIDGEEFKPSLLLYDEADRDISESMIKSFCNTDIKFMFGLTGTPNSKNINESNLNNIFGKSIRSDMGGYNIIPIIKYIRYRTEKTYKFKTYHELRQCLIEDEDRLNEQIKYIKHVMKFRKYGLLLSDRRIEVENFYEALKDEPYNVVLIHGDTNQIDDDKLLNNSILKNKRTLIIGTSGKMSRGIDIPQIDTIFLFYPNKFESATIQSVGRGLRKNDEKQNTLLIDWCDFPILKNQMYSRWKTYRKEYKLSIGKENEAQAI